MTITTLNYSQFIKKLSPKDFPKPLYDSYLFIDIETEGGKNWKRYKTDAEFKKMTDLFLKKLSEFYQKENGNLNGVPSFQNEDRLIEVFLAWDKSLITKSEIQSFLKRLDEFLKNNPSSIWQDEIEFIKSKVISLLKIAAGQIKVSISPKTKKRLTDILSEVQNHQLDGIEKDNQPEEQSVTQIMNSLEFTKLQFSSLGFKGKWLALIGDPTSGFTAMVFGKPKMGKSYLCVDFAGYLARNHGRVLYVAKEEKLDATLQEKLNSKEVAHENLDVADGLPEDLSSYQFVFLDSVNKLSLLPDDLTLLQEKNPNTSFIYVFQSTKDGNFKGQQSFQHDVDVVIEVPEKGLAVQYGRFNQGGELNIFEDHLDVEDNVSMLAGKSDKMKPKKDKPLEITTELGMPLEELAMEYFSKEEDYFKIVETLDNEPKKVEKSVLKMAGDFIKNEKAKVSIKSLSFKEMDSANLNHGAAYFTVVLKGEEKELKKIASDDLLFYYEWEGLEGKAKKQREVFPKWVTPDFLDKADHEDLKSVYRLIKKGKRNEAYNLALSLDTIVREEIPPAVWKNIGGELTPSGEAKLQRQKQKSSWDSLAKYDKRDDELNPRFMFSTTPTQLLSEALKGKFDVMYLIRRQLAARGLDSNGKWIGFEKAEKHHGI
jgi:hypothetical protein